MEATFAGHVYRAGRLDAFKALDVARRYSSVLLGLTSVQPRDGESTVSDEIYGLSLPLHSARMPAEDHEFVTGALLGVVERQQPGGTGWQKVREPGSGKLMFSDITPKIMYELMAYALRENGLLDFFAMPPLTGAATTPAN